METNFFFSSDRGMGGRLIREFHSDFPVLYSRSSYNKGRLVFQRIRYIKKDHDVGNNITLEKFGKTLVRNISLKPEFL